MGRISRKAADELKRTVQIVKGLAPKGAGFADPGMPIRLAKTTVNHAAETTEDVKLWWGDKGDESEGTADRDTVQAYNRYSDIAADEFVYIVRIGPGWEIFPRGGGVTVIGPCGTYTPDEEAEDTDFEVPGPGSCLFPSRIGITIINLATKVATTTPAELIDDDPEHFVYETDSFAFSCRSSSLTVKVRVQVFNTDSSTWMVSTDAPTDGVVAWVIKTSDDSVVVTYRNTIYSLYSDQFGKVQLGPAAAPCNCGTLPDDLCLTMPSR